MMKTKLTMNEGTALGLILSSPRKSGAFWRDLGVHPSVIASLYRKGLVAPSGSPEEVSILRQSWVATEKGVLQ